MVKMPICEMCGRESKLVQADVEGVELNVCSNCAKYGTIKKKVSNFRRQRSHSQNRFVKKKPIEFKVVNSYSTLIRKARESKGMKQEDFAKFLNEKESIVAKWESGSLRPRIDVAKRLGKVLGINLLEKDEVKAVEIGRQKKTDEFTLGDFIKIKKRK